MSSAESFCPRCGDPTVETDVGATRRERALCNDCYFEDFDLVEMPERVEVTVCAHCGALHRGRRWVDVGARDYTDVAIEETTEALGVHVGAEEFDWQVQPEQVDETTIRMHCVFSGVVRGEALTTEVTVPVKIAKQTCQRCGRIAGDSYASVVQVRAEGRTPTSEETQRAREIAEDIVSEMEATGDRDAFVTETTERPEGLDMKLSTNKIGKKVSNKLVEEFGGSVNDSETLVTEDEDGNGVYRVAFAVRLPPFTPGAVIDPDDDEGPVLVRSVQGNLKGVRITTGDHYEASFEDGVAPDARKLGERDDAQETTVVTVEDDHSVQVLDPETYEAKTVARPEYMDPDADTVPVLKSRAGLHVLPDDRAQR
ncbi:60S ribosomal export protein NMD3 [Halospeciosus flavus]|uniref:60S ribosomal export protein NMD3 n=1 Tax=Halospeciosus flavus TaxID=3032283 RepID=A0ABD5Z7C0_9EURY|nr:60S ribosomal export protein NMD3 [Halospeciosus flavus]